MIWNGIGEVGLWVVLGAVGAKYGDWFLTGWRMQKYSREVGDFLRRPGRGPLHWPLNELDRLLAGDRTHHSISLP